jgi:hypothetical protein
VPWNNISNLNLDDAKNSRSPSAEKTMTSLARHAQLMSKYGHLRRLGRSPADKSFSYPSIADEQTKPQALKTASMPFIFPHSALMPDAHLGKGTTIGSVISATRAR